MICCAGFFNAKYGTFVRELISAGKHLFEVVHFGDEQVFAGATTYTSLMFLDKSARDEFRFVKVDNLTAWRNTREGEEGVVPAAIATTDEWNFVIGAGAEMFQRLRQMPLTLEEVTSRIFQGIKTSADKIYIVEEIEREEGRVKVFSREKNGEYRLEVGLLHPLIKGGDSRRYHLSRTKRLILFPYASQAVGSAAIIPPSENERGLPPYLELSARQQAVPRKSRKREDVRREMVWICVSQSFGRDASAQDIHPRYRGASIVLTG